jgi:hypothetical protein
LTLENPQIGQKNVHLTTSLLKNNGKPGSGSAPPPIPSSEGMMESEEVSEYMEFNNPIADPQTVSFVLDCRGLPPALRVAFQFSKLNSFASTPISVVGAKKRGTPGQSIPAGGSPGLKTLALGSYL